MSGFPWGISSKKKPEAATVEEALGARVRAASVPYGTAMCEAASLLTDDAMIQDLLKIKQKVLPKDTQRTMENLAQMQYKSAVADYFTKKGTPLTPAQLTAMAGFVSLKEQYPDFSPAIDAFKDLVSAACADYADSISSVDVAQYRLEAKKNLYLVASAGTNRFDEAAQKAIEGAVRNIGQGESAAR